MSWGRACVLTFLLIAAGCERWRMTTTDQLRSEIAAYERGDPAASEDRIAALFKRLDAEVATVEAEELEKPPAERGETSARREALVAERRELQTAYVGARMKRFGVAADEALKGLGEQIGRGLEEAGRRLRESVEREGTP